MDVTPQFKQVADAPWTQSDGYAAVEWRSRGRCECQLPMGGHPCKRLAQVHHHIAGRGGPDPHNPDNLLHLADACHRSIHAHPRRLSMAARGLWITVLSWSCAQRSPEVPPAFLLFMGGTAEMADELVAAGLWATSGDGWVVVDWSLIDPPKRRRYIPVGTRRAVYERDGYACVTCGDDDDLTLDHIIAYSEGGPDTVQNLQTMCRSCNGRKGDR